MEIVSEWHLDEQDLADASASTILISPSDKDLVLSNLVRYGDIDEYEQSFEDAGQNWHSGGPIVGAKFKFADFSDESKRQIKRKIYNNASEEDTRFFGPVPQSGIKDTDDVVIDYDDEWGLFLALHRDGERLPYIYFYADSDPVLSSLWSIERKSLPLCEAR